MQVTIAIDSTTNKIAVFKKEREREKLEPQKIKMLLYSQGNN